jgi:hypothetical protein
LNEYKEKMSKRLLTRPDIISAFSSYPVSHHNFLNLSTHAFTTTYFTFWEVDPTCLSQRHRRSASGAKKMCGNGEEKGKTGSMDLNKSWSRLAWSVYQNVYVSFTRKTLSETFTTPTQGNSGNFNRPDTRNLCLLLHALQ